MDLGNILMLRLLHYDYSWTLKLPWERPFRMHVFRCKWRSTKKRKRGGVTWTMKIQLNSLTWQLPVGSGYDNLVQQYSSLLAQSQARSCPQEQISTCNRETLEPSPNPIMPTPTSTEPLLNPDTPIPKRHNTNLPANNKGKPLNTSGRTEMTIGCRQRQTQN
jgi:hypothetical protein